MDRPIPPLDGPEHPSGQVEESGLELREARIVVVRGERFELFIERKSKSVWRVSGTYKGRPMQWEGRSVTAAAARWRDHAHISTL